MPSEPSLQQVSRAAIGCKRSQKLRGRPQRCCSMPLLRSAVPMHESMWQSTTSGKQVRRTLKGRAPPLRLSDGRSGAGLPKCMLSGRRKKKRRTLVCKRVCAQHAHASSQPTARIGSAIHTHNACFEAWGDGAHVQALWLAGNMQGAWGCRGYELSWTWCHVQSVISASYHRRWIGLTLMLHLPA